MCRRRSQRDEPAAAPSRPLQGFVDAAHVPPSPGPPRRPDFPPAKRAPPLTRQRIDNRSVRVDRLALQAVNPSQLSPDRVTLGLAYGAAPSAGRYGSATAPATAPRGPSSGRGD